MRDATAYAIIARAQTHSAFYANALTALPLARYAAPRGARRKARSPEPPIRALDAARRAHAQTINHFHGARNIMSVPSRSVMRNKRKVTYYEDLQRDYTLFYFHCFHYCFYLLLPTIIAITQQSLPSETIQVCRPAQNNHHI